MGLVTGGLVNASGGSSSGGGGSVPQSERVFAWALIDQTQTPPAILESHNIASAAVYGGQQYQTLLTFDTPAPSSAYVWSGLPHVYQSGPAAYSTSAIDDAGVQTDTGFVISCFDLVRNVPAYTDRLRVIVVAGDE